MQLINRFIIFILLSLLAGSCIEPFFPDNLDYKPTIFIQAIVTDNPDMPGSVKLSNTLPLLGDLGDLNNYISTSGAIIYIEQDDNNRYYFQENYILHGWGTGVYSLTDPTFILSEDKSYKLVIETSDGHIFESDYESYTPSTPIGDIVYKYETLQQTELGPVSEGYKFYINAAGTGNSESYFRWDLDETYRFSVPYKATHKWNGSTAVAFSSSSVNHCYMDENISGIYLGSTTGLSENRVTNSPLHFVSQYGYKLQIEYSLHAYQYSISQKAFQFWSDLRTLLYETGGLYETQPFKITGNIYCISDPPVNVSGIFEVAGVSEKRIYVPLPTEFRVWGPRCELDSVGTDEYPWSRLPIGAWLMLGDPDPPSFRTSNSECFDCTLKGGYIEKPPFWHK